MRDYQDVEYRRRYSDQNYDRDYSRDYDRDDRGFIDRATDEVRSWFGDEDAERRRRRDHRYDRDDDRIGDYDREHARRYGYRRSQSEYAQDADNPAYSGSGQRYRSRDRDYNRDDWNTERGTRQGYSREYDQDYGRNTGRSYGRGFGRSQDYDSDLRRNYRGDFGRSFGSDWDNTRNAGYRSGSRDYRSRGDFDYERDTFGGSRSRSYGRSRWNEGSDWNEYTSPGTFSYTEYWLIPGPHVGAGPEGYDLKSNDKVKDQVCQRLAQHGGIDASNIRISVEDGEVTLEGTVPDRRSKRMAEDVAESVMGVDDVHNRLRVMSEQSIGSEDTGSTTSKTSVGNGSRSEDRSTTRTSQTSSLQSTGSKTETGTGSTN